MTNPKPPEKQRPGGLAAVVLAAGQGTRMRSAQAKVLHPVCGRPLGAWPVAAARAAGADPIVGVVGHQAEAVETALRAAVPDANLVFALQKEQRGTGHAVICAREALAAAATERVLILCGDVPGLTARTLDALVEASDDAEVALLTFAPEDPAAYGRIVRDAEGLPVAIVEAADATAEQRAITEVNAGIYCVSTALLFEALESLSADNAQGELYLTDLVAHAAKTGRRVAAIRVPPDEVAGVNDRVDLARASARLRRRINEDLMRAGVTFQDPETTYVDAGVTVGPDTLLCAGVHLRGATRIGAGAEIGPYSILQDTTVDSGTKIRAHCDLDSAVIGPNASVGPFARMRPGTVLEAGAAVGNFVETKKSRLGPGVKAGHLSYLGDAEIEAGTNVGAGTITCNYDGANKHKTVIGEGAFIGSNTALVAPVTVGAGAYVAAGSTITQDVPDGALGVARGKQKNLPGWAKRRKRDA
jgi:bifunctional UDP-N-acetylglucosamine pyrophosphorylase / glucosamine-1-phosphate N-acetyltransferase